MKEGSGEVFKFLILSGLSDPFITFIVSKVVLCDVGLYYT